MLQAQWERGNFICVGLDSDYDKLPLNIKQDCSKEVAIFNFNLRITEHTADVACAYKPNLAFYLQKGTQGLMALRSTIGWIHELAPKVPVILDAKNGDIGNTNNGYAEMAFDWLGVDAITVHPYMGKESLKPFLDRKEKGIFILCRTSNPGAGEFQDLLVKEDDHLSRIHPESKKLIPLYEYVASQIANEWNENENCAVVVGATYPAELQRVRRIVREMPILIPGIGTQGGNLEKTVAAGKDSRGKGMIINSSSGIIFAKDPRQKILQLHNLINQYRQGGVA